MSMIMQRESLACLQRLASAELMLAQLGCSPAQGSSPVPCTAATGGAPLHLITGPLPTVSFRFYASARLPPYFTA